jgi:hypothetical protein
MYKQIRNSWNRFHLRKQIQAVNTLYDRQIEASDSPRDARKLHQRKVDHICEIAARFVDRNKLQ